MARGTTLCASIFPDHGRAFPRVLSCLILGLLSMTLVAALPRSPAEALSSPSTRLTAPGPAPSGIPLPVADARALEPDPGSERDGPADRADSDGPSGAELVESGTVEPAGARARAVNLKFVTFVHVLRGQARATPTAGTRAPPLV